MQPLAMLRELTASCVSGESAAIGRILIGSAALLQALHTGALLPKVLDPGVARVPFAGWLPVPPESIVPVYVMIWAIAAVTFAAGWRTTASGIALTLTMGYSILIDQQTYSNHVYLMTIVVGLLTLAGAGSRFSLDARFGRSSRDIPEWPLTLIRIQLSIVYLFAAVSKINLVYLAGVTIAPNLGNGWLLPLPESFIRVDVLFALAFFSIALELFLAFGLWVPRHRKAALLAGVGLHTFIVLGYPASSIIPLSIFTMTMFAMYAQFVDPAAWRRQHRRHVARQIATVDTLNASDQASTPR